MSKQQGDPISPKLAGGLFALALVVGAIIFAQALSYGIIPSWDDAVYVVERPEVRDWWGVSWWQRLATPRIGYALPLPTFLYAHAHILLGGSAFPGLHGLSLGLHLVNCILVLCLVRRWENERMAAVVAALWLVHPVVVESVVWLTNLKTVLAASFVLLAMLLWQRMLEQGERTLKIYAGVFTCFVLALMCRPDAAVLPFVLAAQSLTRPEPRRALRRHAISICALLPVAVGYVALADAGHDQVVQSSVFREEGPAAFLARVFHAFEVAVGNLFWPLDLQPAYFQHAGEGVLEALPGLLLAIALLVLMVGLARAGKTRELFPIVLATFFYAPFSNILFLPRFTADTYLYLVSFAVIYALALGVTHAIRHVLRDQKTRTSVTMIISSLVFAGLSVVSWSQVQRWENALTLWAPVMAAQPGATRPYRHVIWELVRQERWQEAREVVDEALPVFRANRAIPAFVPIVLRQTGDAAKAADVALQALSTNVSVEKHHHRALLETLVSAKLPLPSAPEVLEQVERSIAVYLEQPQWMAQDNVGTGFTSYFLDRGRPEFARPFLAFEFGRNDAPCVTWTLVEMMPPAQRNKMDIPSLPPRCIPD